MKKYLLTLVGLATLASSLFGDTYGAIDDIALQKSKVEWQLKFILFIIQF